MKNTTKFWANDLTQQFSEYRLSLYTLVIKNRQTKKKTHPTLRCSILIYCIVPSLFSAEIQSNRTKEELICCLFLNFLLGDCYYKLDLAMSQRNPNEHNILCRQHTLKWNPNFILNMSHRCPSWNYSRCEIW